MQQDDVSHCMQQLGLAARKSAFTLATATSEQKNEALLAIAAAIRQHADTILAANQRDLQMAEKKQSSAAFLDRLRLTQTSIEAMAAGIEAIAALPDPIGTVLASWERPNGLHISRVRVPLGVIGVIYESRPNVTADAAALCLKSSNAVILRGGSESFQSAQAIMTCIQEGLEQAGLPIQCMQMVPSTDRAYVGEMLTMDEYIDVIVPRGGKSLIQRISQESRIPLFKHLEGICHTYLHESANLDMARTVVFNAKMRRTGICGATETLLIDQKIAKTHLPSIIDMLIAEGCEVRGDADVCALDKRVIPATEDDWNTEYLDAIISVKIVDDLMAAISHIRQHGSQHTDSIIADDEKAAQIFLQQVDSAIVMHNASTQFADGGEFGMGAEIGISTGKLHARGPVGVEQLTTFKYHVQGTGQTRPK